MAVSDVPGAVERPDELASADIVYPGPDGAELRGYLSHPRGSSPRPGVLVLHELFGLVEHTRDVTRRLANVGFTALAPDLYTRVGAPADPSFESGREKLAMLADEDVIRDLGAAVNYLRGRDDAAGRVGCLGFCSGGRYALLAAARGVELDAAIDCWGGFITRANPDDERTAQRPVPPVELVDEVGCPVLAVFGAEDTNPSPEVAAELERRAQAAGAPVEVEVFDDAGHAFFADYRPNHYRAQAAYELWPRMLDHLRRHLGDRG